MLLIVVLFTLRNPLIVNKVGGQCNVGRLIVVLKLTDR